VREDVELPIKEVPIRSHSVKKTALFISVLCLVLSCTAASGATLSLAGEWDFQLDPANKGINEEWFRGNLNEHIPLPGSTDEAGFGTKTTQKHLGRLSREYEYVGAAWYAKQVNVPAKWNGKRIELFLERCHWETRLWVDGKEMGMRESLSVPHVYDLSDVMSPGDHDLVIRVDNTPKYRIGGWGHSITDETQTNWNGIVGRLELRASEPVSVESAQIYPDVNSKSVKVIATLRNVAPEATTRSINAKVLDANGKTVTTASIKQDLSPNAENTATFLLPMGDDVSLWSEFSPDLYSLELKVEDSTYSATFGMREVGVKDTRITINDHPIFLRGTLECCIFPLTGYPPTDVASWRRILKICRSYGLNHMRFHSWCPPEAAFLAADELGVYFQVELPSWTAVGVHEPTDQYFREELDRILDTYGSHPSFTFMCMGNELTGEPSFLTELIRRGKARDSRHLYTGRTAWGTVEGDDYYVTHHYNGAVRGILGAGTDRDFRAAMEEAEIPIVSHEIGQWCVYPDYDEIKKYKGHLKPRNFEVFRESLAENHMLDQNKDFQQASGALMTLLYKEEMEAALRTPGFDGFQLLDLHDFPGQGSALVGTLDAFWDSKGFITPEEFRRYCSPTVPLLRMSKRIWKTTETFTAEAQVANFGVDILSGAVLTWEINDAKGKNLASGELAPIDIPIGNETFPGKFFAPLAKAKAPAKFEVRLAIMGTDLSNSWEIWIYPDEKPIAKPDDILVASSVDEAVEAQLDSGGKVLLLFTDALARGTVSTEFVPIFWNSALFKGQKRQLGLLCDPNHPALAEFPTDSHTNWQWYDLLNGAQLLNLGSFDPALRPIVQVIDDWYTNRRLGLIVEAKVGKGKLLTCGVRLGDEDLARPEARQLRKSLLAYMQGKDFNPEHSIRIDELAAVFRHPYLEVESVSSENPGGGEGHLAVDGDPATLWSSEWQNSVPKHPHSITLRLPKIVALSGMRYVPRDDGNTNGWISDYEIHVGVDGESWGEAVAQGTFQEGTAPKIIDFKESSDAKYIRLTALRGFQGKPWTSVAELDVIFTQGQAIALNHLVGEGNVRVDDQAVGHEALNAIDGEPATFWHTTWGPEAPNFPHLIQVDTQKQADITGMRWLPRQDMYRGHINDYEIYVILSCIHKYINYPWKSGH